MRTKQKWQLLSTPFNTKLNSALQQQHIAAQFISLVGRYIVPAKSDLSNINMQYHAERKILFGTQLPDRLYIGLHLIDFKVQILSSQLEVIQELLLNGKSFNEAFQEFKAMLTKLGVDVSALKAEQPFELSTESLQEGKYFLVDSEANREIVRLRYNAEFFVNELAASFNDANPVRIWPHHFDTGTFFPVATNEKGDAVKTIGIGWAISDGMIDEPYFYISFWSENPLNDMSKLSLPGAGKWMMPGWNGAVLKHSEILVQNSAQQQYDLVSVFFNSGIKTLLSFLNSVCP